MRWPISITSAVKIFLGLTIFISIFFYQQQQHDASYFNQYFRHINHDSDPISPAPTISQSKPIPEIRTRATPLNRCIANETQPWIALDDYNVLLYSAYVDSRISSKPSIRLVLYKNFGLKHRATCVLKTADGTNVSLQGQFDSINAVSPFCPGGCSWRYESFFLVCPLDNNVSSINMKSVSVQVNREKVESRINDSQSAAIPVCDSSPPTHKRTVNLTICVPALFNFDDWFRLVTFIEYYRQSGAGKFVFYEKEVSVEVSRVLRFYEQRGVADVLPWPRIPHSIPEPPFVKAFESISNHGQIVNSNDCILRVSTVTEFVAMIDIDEYIGASNTPSTVDWLTKSLPIHMPRESQIGGLQYRSAMAHAKWPPKRVLDGVRLWDLTIDALNSTFTIGDINRAGTRSKMIFRTCDADWPAHLDQFGFSCVTIPLAESNFLL